MCWAQRREYAAGEYLAQEGERAEEIFYIEAGAVEICYSRRQAADEDLLDDAVRPPAHLAMRLINCKQHSWQAV